MGIWMAVVMAATVFPPEEGDLPHSLEAQEESLPVEAALVARVGVWGGRPFKFQAIRTDNTQATSKEEALFSASALAGTQLYGHLMLLGTFEADLASKLTGELEGGYLGWNEHPKEHYGDGVPDEVMLYAGAVFGHLKFHEADFGTFDRGVGFAGGVSLGWSVASHTTAMLMVEYRYIKFNYQSTVVSGNTSIGGSTVWAGVGIELRF